MTPNNYRLYQNYQVIIGTDFAAAATSLTSEQHTDYRYECVSKKVRVGAGQYLKWIVGFTTSKNELKST